VAGPAGYASGAAETAFRYVFFASAASMMVALVGLAAMEEKAAEDQRAGRGVRRRPRHAGLTG